MRGASGVTAAAPVLSPNSWRILSPLPGTTLLLDPDFPQGGRALSLRVDPPGAAVFWSSLGLTIEDRTASLIPGRHEVTVRNPATGREVSTWVLVRRL